MRAGGTSVHEPWAISAAMPMLSPSVGCGWMVLPMSTASAPISMARAISPIMSPAWVPTMPPPKILPWPRPAWPSPDPASGLSSNSSLVKPSSRPLAMARPEAAQGNRPFLTLHRDAGGDDYLRGRMPVDARTRQPAGVLHGGVSVDGSKDPRNAHEGRANWSSTQNRSPTCLMSAPDATCSA